VLVQLHSFLVYQQPKVVLTCAANFELVSRRQLMIAGIAAAAQS
jgi:hypothetical protein